MRFMTLFIFRIERLWGGVANLGEFERMRMGKTFRKVSEFLINFLNWGMAGFLLVKIKFSEIEPPPATITVSRTMERGSFVV